VSTERPLAGWVVGISVSETEEMDRLGFDRAEMNRCVIRLSESLFAAGARLAFGHDWRPGGVMEAVAALAVRYFNVRRGAHGQPAEREAPIINRVAPPDIPYLSQQQMLSNDESASAAPPPNPMVRLLEGIVDARQTPAPAGTQRATALSLMREELAELCDIRVCLGGKLSGFGGTMPGILEEALGSLRKQRPVFASGIFGGASRIIVHAMSNGRVEFPTPVRGEGLIDVARELRARSGDVRRGLEAPEEDLLWRSTSIEQSVELILRGAVQLATRSG
jgi:hypothetical protein